MVVARVWRGVVRRAKSAEYLKYLKKTGMKDYLQTPGNAGASIWTRDYGNKTEFIVVSFWKSIGAIKKFAGEDIGKARYYPNDPKFLMKLEPGVKHYKVASKL